MTEPHWDTLQGRHALLRGELRVEVREELRHFLVLKTSDCTVHVWSMRDPADGPCHGFVVRVQVRKEVAAVCAIDVDSLRTAWTPGPQGAARESRRLGFWREAQRVRMSFSPATATCLRRHVYGVFCLSTPFPNRQVRVVGWRV